VFLANTAPEGDKSIKGFENDPNLDRQIEIWQAVCGELQTISDSNELADWLDQIEPYLHTSFDPNKIIHLHNLQKKTHLEFSCEFPTLTLKNP
jgi:hypothetical protein